MGRRTTWIEWRERRIGRGQGDGSAYDPWHHKDGNDENCYNAALLGETIKDSGHNKG